MQFLYQFNLSPIIIQNEIANYVFRMLTRDKTGDNKGITYEEFEEALVRLSVKG